LDVLSLGEIYILSDVALTLETRHTILHRSGRPVLASLNTLV